MTKTKRVTGRPYYHYPGCVKIDQTGKAVKTYDESYARKHWELCDVCAGDWEEKNRKAAKMGASKA